MCDATVRGSVEFVERFALARFPGAAEQRETADEILGALASRASTALVEGATTPAALISTLTSGAGWSACRRSGIGVDLHVGRGKSA